MAKHELTPHELYLKKIKRNRIAVILWRIVGLLALLGIWELASYKEWIDSFIFSSPSGIVKCFISMLTTQDLLTHTWITLRETFISFSLTIIIGLFVAVVLWRFKMLADIFEPYIVVLNSLPKSALAPLMLVWLGANQKTIIISGMSVGIFGAILSLYTGFLKVDTEQVKLIETLGGKKKDVLAKVMIPSTLPILINVMKVSIGLNLVGVVIGEFFAANSGLGYLIIYGSQVFKLDMVVMSIMILCLLTILFYQAIHMLEKSVSKIFMM